MEKHDVVIIGGGIAGLTLAKFLAEYGIDFVLLEEHKDFFMKACGEGIIPYMMGYNFFDLYESKVGIERMINEAIIYTKYGNLNLHIPVLMTNKKEIEGEIAKQAIKKGADIRMDEKVKKIEKGRNVIIMPQNIEAKLIVGADGFFSQTRKYIGIKQPKYAIAVEGLSDDINLDENKIHVEFKKDVVRYGYSWFFPKKKVWNIGIGSFDPKEFKKSFEKFKKNYAVNRWKAGYIPISKPLKAHGKNAILVGDAASQTNASIGAGNMSSIICANIAAKVIKNFSNKNFFDIDLAEYEKALKKIRKTLSYEYNFTFIFHKIIRSEYIQYKILKKVVKETSEYYKKLEKKL